MGRFRTWIDRARQSRPGRRRAAGTTVRRRSLAFEQFESRLALSAATQPVYEIDVSNLATRDELLARFDLTSTTRWTDGLATSRWQWVQSDGGLVELVVFSPRAGGTLSPPLGGGPAGTEGGLIAFGSRAQFQLNAGLQSSAMDRAEAPFAGQVQGMLRNAFQPSPAGDMASEFFLNDFDAAGTMEMDRPRPSSAFDSGPAAPSLELSSLESFGDAKNDSGPAGSVTPATAAPPVLRITIPAGLVRSEGGVIDLTATAGPTSLTPRDSQAHMAATGAAPAARLASAAASARAELPVESIRARAVVFEVASSADASEADIEEALRRLREQGNRWGEADANAGDHDAARGDAARSARLLSSTAGDADATTAFGDALAPPSAGSARGDRDSAPAQRGAEARDEALAGLLDERGDHAGQDDGFAFAPTGPQKAGLALAIAIGAGPLVRRARRARASATIEQASDPERESKA